MFEGYEVGGQLVQFEAGIEDRTVYIVSMIAGIADMSLEDCHQKFPGDALIGHHDRREAPEKCVPAPKSGADVIAGAA